ncbi:MAG TPA: fumarylacetoacetate hydrolase family protein [Rhodanobacteraceae bacterium]|nr:fumarylacetoacetate hydrolase family protein [Rhodanobacteraceae bacterium]
MSEYCFAPASPASVPVSGSAARFPLRRIFCIGRNYADHAREMGATVDRGRPVFFCKPADAVVVDGADPAYPPATANLQHEVEMTVALQDGGRDIPAEAAEALVFGYGVGLDLTRRDLQAQAKAGGLPWDTAKAFDQSAPLSPLRPVADCGHPRRARLTLAVGGALRQDADIAAMIWSVPEIIAALSTLFELRAGDLIFTGTPAGVGPLRRGDRFEAELHGIARLAGRIA